MTAIDMTCSPRLARRPTPASVAQLRPAVLTCSLLPDHAAAGFAGVASGDLSGATGAGRLNQRPLTEPGRTRVSTAGTAERPDTEVHPPAG